MLGGGRRGVQDDSGAEGLASSVDSVETFILARRSLATQTRLTQGRLLQGGADDIICGIEGVGAMRALKALFIATAIAIMLSPLLPALLLASESSPP
jgi:hypothetical protein